MRICSHAIIWLILVTHATSAYSQSFHPLGFLPGANRTYSDAITADGTRVFGASGEDHRGMLTMTEWTATGGLNPLAMHPDGQRVRPLDVSGSGQTAVGLIEIWGNDDYELEAFRWSEDEGFVRLGDFPGGRVWSFATGVSDDGQVIVGAGNVSNESDGLKLEAFRWTPSTGIQGLGYLPNAIDQSSAADVSSDGSVIMGFSTRFERNRRLYYRAA